MKNSLIGYVTALTNVHYDQLNRVPPTNIQARVDQKSFIDELNGLLDFIEGIQEEKPLVINICNRMEEK